MLQSRTHRSLLPLIILTCFFLTFLNLPASAQDVTIQLSDVVHSIQAHRARWNAGDTTISRLPHADRLKRLGALEPQVTKEELETSKLLATPPLGTLPGSLTWQNYTGGTLKAGNYVTPVRDQKYCGSCWAFATTAALEAQYLVTQNSPLNSNLPDVNLAEQTLVSCGGAGSCSGGYIDRASNYLVSTGLPVETCFPYTSSNNYCGNACVNWQSTAYRLVAWHYVATSNPTVDSIKNALAVYGPLVTSMAVYSDFYYYRSGVYSYTSGSYQGGHAILIVGYDDVNRCFIVKNSWGTGWGEAGFFRIAYTEVGGTSGFGRYTMAYEGCNGPNPPSPTPPSPPTPPEPPTPPVPPEPPQPPSPCSYSISPTAKTFDYRGGSANLTVTASNGCSWTAKSNASWLMVVSGSSGVGNRSVYYYVSANISRTQRVGTITVAGKTFTVTQNGM